MPNWCINNLSVYGNAETLEKFVFANMGLPAQYLPIPSEKEDCLNGQEKHNNEYFCFNALVPTPKEILDIINFNIKSATFYQINIHNICLYLWRTYNVECHFPSSP